MKLKVSFIDLKDEVKQYRKANPVLKDDSAFVLWFMHAYLDDSEEATAKALTGETGDKNADAILIDERAKQVHLIQGKFRHSLAEHPELRNDVLAFADLANYPWRPKAFLDAYYNKLGDSVREKFEMLVHHARDNSYALRLYFVTTGRCSDTKLREAIEVVNQAEGPAKIAVFDGHQVMTIYRNYLLGNAPAVPELILPIDPGDSSGTDRLIHRYDPVMGIDSWVFSMSSPDVGDMFTRAGVRLFARNIRGYLGRTNEINDAMTATVQKHPENFWYFNNGVTIVCEGAKRETQGREDVLTVERPQVINGQQTTRTLHKSSSDHATVLVKVIKITRSPNDDDKYDDLVSSIVRSTNWQNEITPSDLVSNDAIQVFLERELRKRGYQYIRKRQTKSEIRAMMGGSLGIQIKKEQLAQAVAACEYEPSVALKGKEILFEDPYYKKVFRSRSISFYLGRYWLMKQVVGVSRGKRQLAYAKWLVLHFLWENLSNEIGGQAERKFRYACENAWDDGQKALGHLEKAIRAAFKAALLFYRRERGRGEEAMDRQTFFKQPQSLCSL